MILAGTSAKGACPTCGAPWERVVGKEFVPQVDTSENVRGIGNQKPMDASNRWEGVPRGTMHMTTLGWIPTCTCYGVELPRRVRIPKAPDDAEPPFVCEACGGTGKAPPLPLLDLPAPCPECGGEGRRPGNDVWQEWRAECDQVLADQKALLTRIEGLDLPTEPCTVIDPFAGAGTTGLVAQALDRQWALIELSQKYCDDHIIPRLSDPVQVQMAV